MPTPARWPNPDYSYVREHGRYWLEFRRENDNSWHLSVATNSLEGCEAWIDYDWATRERDYALRVFDSQISHVVIQLQPNLIYDESWCQEFPDIPYSEYSTLTPNLTGKIRNMIKVKGARVGGKLMLLINAKEFHDELDKIGVAHDGSKYLDQPSSSCEIANSSFSLSPRVLLKRDYKEVEIMEYKKGDSGELLKEKKLIPVTCAADLTGLWSTPPTFENLKKLANSANVVARQILEHYQPIDISVEIHKRILK